MGVEIRRAVWATDEQRIKSIRQQVFVEEQDVDPAIEWDGRDAQCAHVLAMAEGRCVGTGRLRDDGRIGRMAVLAPWRGRGLGGALLVALIDIACERGLCEVSLHSQVHAVSFYQKYGFESIGAVFQEAGIDHRHMVRRL